MTGKPKFVRPAAQRAVAAAMEHHDRTGSLPARSELDELAQASGYSPRHLRRLIAKALAGDQLWATPEFTLDEVVVTAVFLCCGNLAKARRQLERAGVTVPSDPHFRRVVAAQLGTDQLAYAKRGSAGFRDTQAYLKSHFPHRNHTVQLDHSELQILVVPRGSKTAVKPWITTVLEAKTRYLLGYAVTFGRPSSEEVRAALMSAIIPRYAPDGVTIVGGVPDRAVWDRGLEFVSNVMTESCLRLRVLPAPLPAYSPHLKGRQERFYRFFQDDCLSHLPGYNAGPADLRGNRAAASSAMGEDDLLDVVADWMDWYVSEHRIAGGETPLEMWARDATPLRHVSPEQLWVDMLIAKNLCKVSKNGVRFDRIDWTAPELTGLVGRKVEIRYMPIARDFVEVFLDGEHKCTAYPVAHLTADQEEAVKQRRVDRRRLAQRRGTTANRQRRRNAPNGTLRLDKDNRGVSHVIEADVDLLDGPEVSLDDLVSSAQDQGQLW